MKYDFITIGGAVIDETFKADEGELIDNSQDILRQKLIGFEYGAKVILKDHHEYFGGGASNAAVCLSRLGFKSAAFVQVGNDERGLKILANFKKEKVSIKFVKVSHELSTGFSFVLVTKGNEHIIFTSRGANESLSVNFVEKKALEQGKWLYISSLSGEWEKVLDKALAVVGPKKAWNPGSTQLKAGLRKLSKYIKKVDVLVLNQDEATELAISDKKYKKKSKAYLKKTENLLKILKSYCSGIVVITKGDKGAYAYDGEKIYHEKAKKIAGIQDTTGVGDAFSSSFVAGLHNFNGNIKRAMKLGIQNSGYVLKKTGAQNGLMKI
ncbi:hypothetical protein GF382_02015 [Candidatus Falkowbacteria bacterium]|nr:hypothetical protein [Candidatus Falkowbacteria bacterium]